MAEETFKEKIHNLILPTINDMIKKEEEHIEKLKGYGLSNINSLYILKANKMLAHLKQRKKEYEDYAKKL